ncbi:glutamate--tRNA ligase [Candidatus Woesearchaeota archaeon]|nr:glutamate--tRNA ligase [Candidatus Woesearchaeota archaeon]
MENSILKYALENAVKFKGKANPGAVVGKILGEFPDAKNDMKATSQLINNIIKEVNGMSLEDQEKKLLEIDPDYFENQKEQKQQRQEQRKELPELKNAEEGKVVTRIAPEPSKYNHIGHAMSFLLNYMYSIKYKGRCILRFDDTNPEMSKQEYVDAMQSDVLEYLDIKTAKVVFASDHMDDFIVKAEQLIDEGKAYTSDQPSEEISKYRRDMKDHPNRDKEISIVKKEWGEMKKANPDYLAYSLRLKISMQHKNAVMRDPVIFRIITDEHYRHGDKYKVWPMYDFECAVMEGILGVTHVLRSNEFDSRIELQDHIRSLFNLTNPTIRQYARTNVKDATTKGREIRELIKTGEYIGWDDPRLITLRALKRRGIVKEAYYELAKVIGMSKTTSELDFRVIAAINRQLLDESAQRFFAIVDPMEITIEGAPEQELALKYHQHKEDRGRKFKTNDKFLVEKEDLEKIKDGELIRLMDCLNFKKSGDKFIFTSTDLEEYKKDGKAIIHWLPADDCIDIEILMPDCKTKKAKAETSISQLKEGAVIQFERYAFCRLDSIDKDKGMYKFWYSHD